MANNDEKKQNKKSVDEKTSKEKQEIDIEIKDNNDSKDNNDKKEKKDKHKKELANKDEEISSLKKQLEMFKDKYYRAIADMDNQRKQYDKEYHQTLKYASQNLAEKLLPSFEMFSMVIESGDKLPSEVKNYVIGFDMVYRQMIQALESEGISEIKVQVGDKFDHTIHSAMETQEVSDEKLDNTITKIIRKGYKIHDRLIKPVAVVVGKLKKDEEVEEVKDNKIDNQAKA